MAAACAVMHAFAAAMHCGTSPGGNCADAGIPSDDSPNDRGSVVINATVAPADCPKITGIVATPYAVDVGSSALVTATVSASESGTPTLRWSAPSGSFADPSAAETTFVCAVPGSVLLSVTATLGGCIDTSNVPVDCRAPAP
jgi:hypothetical protein